MTYDDPPVPYASGCFVTTLTIVDVTGDGVRDVVLSDYPSRNGQDSVSVLKNLGKRALAPETSYPASGEVRSLAIADFNGDGLPDVATSDSEFSNVVVFINAGGGTFQPQAVYPVGNAADGGLNFAYSLAAGDLDGDGLADIAVSEPAQDIYPDNGGGVVGVLLNRGDGVLKPERTYPLIPGQPDGGGGTRGGFRIAIADLNGDGHRDIVITTLNEHLGVYLNNGDGTFAPENQQPLGAQTYDGGGNRIAIDDLDGDGRPDIVLTNPQGPAVGVLLNIGAGAFAPVTPVVPSPSVVYEYQYMAMIDLDNDGRQDLVTSSFYGAMPGISTFLNLGGAMFAPPSTYPLVRAGANDIFIDAMAVGISTATGYRTSRSPRLSAERPARSTCCTRGVGDPPFLVHGRGASVRRWTACGPRRRIDARTGRTWRMDWDERPTRRSVLHVRRRAILENG